MSQRVGFAAENLVYGAFSGAIEVISFVTQASPSQFVQVVPWISAKAQKALPNWSERQRVRMSLAVQLEAAKAQYCFFPEDAEI